MHWHHKWLLFLKPVFYQRQTDYCQAPWHWLDCKLAALEIKDYFILDREKKVAHWISVPFNVSICNYFANITLKNDSST